jgi:hypothetical protein
MPAERSAERASSHNLDRRSLLLITRVRASRLRE